MAFATDLKKGQENERRFAHWLEEKGATEIKYNAWKDYDVMATLGGRIRTFEIKTDFATTENVAIEFFCLRRKEPSGISSTRADYWVQFEGYGNGMMWKTSDLLDFIRSNKPKMVYGGDGKMSLMFLVKKEELPPSRLISFDVGNGYF